MQRQLQIETETKAIVVHFLTAKEKYPGFGVNFSFLCEPTFISL